MPTTLLCPQKIDPAVLSAYLDGALGAAQTAQVREHLATCTACQRQLAELSAVGALLRRPAPALESSPAQQRRTWLAVRARITQPKRSFTMSLSLSRATVWKAAGVVVAALLVAALAWQFVTHGASRTAATHLKATATPPLPTLQQIWGAGAIKHVTPDRADFEPQNVASDGSFALGTLVGSDPAVASMDVTTGHVTIIYTRKDSNISSGISDGRFIVWSVQPNDPNSSIKSEEQMYEQDLRTKQTRVLIASPVGRSGDTGFYGVLGPVGLDHGVLLWTHNGAADGDISLNLTDLATNQQRTIATGLGGNSPDAQLVWPYVFYQDQYATLHLYHIPDGKDQRLPATNICQTFTFTGQALYCPVGLVSKAQPITDVQALRGADLTKASWHSIYVVPSNIPPEVNDRLILASDGFPTYHGYVWDQVLQKTAALPSNLDQMSQVRLQEKWLTYTTTDNGKTLFIVDTSQLPTK